MLTKDATYFYLLLCLPPLQILRIGVPTLQAEVSSAVPSQSGSGLLVGVVPRMGVECFLSALVFLSVFTGQSNANRVRTILGTTNGTCCRRYSDSCICVGCNLNGSLSSNFTCKPGNYKKLNLSLNNFTAIDGSFWEESTNLSHLNLSFNNISENLTSNNIRKLTSLEDLDLSCNNFSGYLPYAIENLSSLKVAKLKGNMFTLNEKTNNVCFGSSLVHLDLSNNRYAEQTFPCVKNWSNLTHLDLSNANLSGEISPNVSRLVDLQHLDLSQNNFSADLQDAIRSLPSLTFVNLNRNKIKWNTSCFNGPFKHLDLSGNRFGSKPFPCVKNLVNLTHLDLSNAIITGEIRKEISQLVKLEYLNLSHNHLNGSIPDLAAMVNLRELDLSSNNLTGNITSQLHDKLIKMSKFNLSGNSHLQVCSSFFQGNRSSIVGLKRINCTKDGGNQSSGGSKGKVPMKVLYAVLVPIVVLVLVLVFLAFAYRKRKHLCAGNPQHKKGKYHNLGPYSFQTESSSWSVDVKLPTSLPIIIIDKPLLNLTFEDLLSATSNFDGKALYAEGRFGPVYHGVLPGEVHVDIKVLVHNSVLTDQEVATELQRLGRIKHSNLVPLIGYCLAGAQRIIVQEHMKNGNLQALLHDSPIGCEKDDTWGEDDSDAIGYIISEGKNTWEFRHRVALGIARGLAFLHHGCSPQIVHGDVQSSSILLDDDFEPRFSDYGLAELIESNVIEENPYGSPGYAPRVTSSSTIHCRTPESDVYAFGIVLFELVTGKKPFEDVKDTDMLSWVRRMVAKNLFSDTIDARIWVSKQEKQMEEALRIGYLCTAEVPSKRPSMQQIVGLLKDIGPRDLNDEASFE